MKKYKLIKAYPNSTNEGTIVRQDDLGQYVSEKPLAILEKVEVEGYPSFWEEVKEEPNYLITAFRNKNIPTQIFYLQSKGGYNETASIGEMSLKSMLNGFASLEDGALEIYSVKNSKGDEFTIGYKAFFKIPLGQIYPPTKILKFEVNEDIILATTEDRQGNIYFLENIVIYEKPLYTTTDGVDIFEGNKIEIILYDKEDTTKKIHGGVEVNSFNKEDAEVCKRFLTFTSEENRDKYIKENQRKPIFVSADNVEFFESHLGGDYSLFSVLPKANWQENRYRLNDCIKFPKKEWLHFHTKESRQEYIDNNKPKFSLKEIESCYPSPTDSPLFTTFIANLKKLGK